MRGTTKITLRSAFWNAVASAALATAAVAAGPKTPPAAAAKPAEKTADASTLPIAKVEFVAKTNVPAIKVDGANAKPLVAKITLDGPIVKTLETEISPNDLATGLSLRDTHMRDAIFKMPDGSYPPVKFRLTKPLALGAAPTKAEGVLTLRGKEAPFAPNCHGSVVGKQVKADCDGEISLADHGIEAPTHMGVKVKPTVQLTIAADSELSP